MSKEQKSRKQVPEIHGRKLTLKFKKRTLSLKATVNLLHKSRSKKVSLPSKIDWSSKTGPVRDQGNIGCCVSFSMTTSARFLLARDHETPYILSPLFLYYITRVKEMGESPSEDSGSTLEDAIDAMEKYGVCQETLWPFSPKKMAVAPSSKAIQDAKKYKLITYAPIAQNLESIQSCLAAGFIVNVGLMIYSSFESDKVMKSGNIPMPSSSDSQVGGHAVVLVGYDNSTRKFLLQNSWGPNAGKHGFFYIPYEYVLNPELCSEIFCLTDFSNLSE